MNKFQKIGLTVLKNPMLLLILIIIGPFVLIPLGIMPEGRVLFPSDWTDATQSAAQSNRCPTEMIKYCRFRRRRRIRITKAAVALSALRFRFLRHQRDLE